MTIKRRKFIKGIRIKPENIEGVSGDDLTLEGEIGVDSDDNKLKARLDSETRSVVTEDQSQTLTNKIIDGTVAGGANNTVKTDSVKVAYDNAIETAISLENAEDPAAPVENVQEAIDSIKRALDNQNEASEIEYIPTNGGDWDDPDPSDVKAALDQAASRIKANESAISTNSGGLSDHTDPGAEGAHQAENIEVTAFGNLESTDVGSALNELQSDIDTRALADNGTIKNASIETPSKLEVKQGRESDLITYAGTANDGQIVFATDTKKMYQIIDNELEPIGGGGSTSFEISQTTHGFAVGDGIYHNGTTWVTAQADDPDTLAYHVVVQGSETDVDLFIAADFGRIIEVPLGDNSIHSLVAGEYYFLSDSVAGKPTNVEPSTFSNPLFYVESIDATDVNNQIAVLQIKCLRPEQVGADTNLDDISDVSASTAVEGDIIKYNGSFWESSKVTEQVISLVAAEGLSARDALYINASGQAAKVDADDDNKIEFIGFARASALISESVDIVISGKLGGFSGLTPGEFVYADPSTPGGVVQSEPTQANVYIIKLGKAISSTEILVNPDLAVSAEFSSGLDADDTITNGATNENVSGLLFDGTIHRAAKVTYSIYRYTDTEELSQVGDFKVLYKPIEGTWSLGADNYHGDNAGVTFTITSSGQVQYTSTSLVGANYGSKLQIKISELFDI